MLIRKIEVRNFKCLSGPLVVDGFKEGINIIAADNEAGKSTLLQAIKAAVFERHNSTAQQVKEFRPYKDGSRPEVSLDLEFKSQRYSIRKAFLSKSMAEFKSPDGHSEGSEAEEKIRDFFGLPNDGAPAKKAAKVDTGIWGLLWLDQAIAEDGLKTTAAGKETLMRALESEFSAVNAGQRGRMLLRSIEKQTSLYYSPANRKEKGELEDAAEAVAYKKNDLDEHISKFNAFEAKQIKLQETQEKLSEYEKNKSLEAAVVAIEDASRNRGQLDQLKSSLDAASAAEDNAAMQLEQAQAQTKNRKNLLNRKEEINKTITELSKQLENTKAKIAEQKTKLAELERKRDEAHNKHTTLETQCEHAEKKQQLETLQKSETAIKAQLGSLKELEEKLLSKSSEHAEIKVNDNLLSALRKLDKDLINTESRCNAAATRITLKPMSGQKASIESKEISKEETLSLTKASKIDLSGWGEIQVLPGGEETEELVKGLDKLQKEMQETLTQAGVESIEIAEEQLRSRKQLELEITTIKKEISSQGDKQALANNLATVESRLKEAQSAMASVQHQSHDENKALEELKAELKTTRAALNGLEETLKEENAIQASLSMSLNKTEIELKSSREQIQQTEQSLTESSKLSDEELAKRETDCSATLQEAKQKAQDIRNQISKLKETELQDAVDEARRKHKILDQQIRQLNIDKGNLTGELNAVGQSGLGETIERLKGELELAEKKLKQLRRKAEALLLLSDTLKAAESESKDQIFQPVLEIMRPYMQVLFGGGELNFDDSIELSEFDRNGQKETYEGLSTGTREQLSVLTRIAVAKLLKQQGQASIILLDDALVYSDDNRFAKMKEILKEVSAEIQVIILTCRLRDYQDIPESNMVAFSRTGSAVLS